MDMAGAGLHSRSLRNPSLTKSFTEGEDYEQSTGIWGKARETGIEESSVDNEPVGSFSTFTAPPSASPDISSCLDVDPTLENEDLDFIRLGLVDHEGNSLSSGSTVKPTGVDNGLAEGMIARNMGPSSCDLAWETLCSSPSESATETLALPFPEPLNIPRSPGEITGVLFTMIFNDVYRNPTFLCLDSERRSFQLDLHNEAQTLFGSSCRLRYSIRKTDNSNHPFMAIAYGAWHSVSL